MMKGESGIFSISNHVAIIDAYIIDELNERNRILHDDGAAARLPCPRYEVEQDEVNAENDEETVIIIDL